MKIFIYSNEEQEKEIRQKSYPDTMTLFFSRNSPTLEETENHDAFFLLHDDNEIMDLTGFKNKPVVIHSVTKNLANDSLPTNVARINAWPGFLQRTVWEIAHNENEVIPAIFKKLQWDIIKVKDEPGLISGRVISMIINEAFFALKEGVSTKKEIDLAMKLGTNYPYGPFEWAEKIGIDKVYDLLNTLSQSDIRCTPSFNKDGKINIS
ncbi:MAG: 3-hydroxyacyl-CoA dehydrogenase family protein [Ginsengibacter sp.]